MGKGKLFVALDFLVNLGGPWLVYRLVEGSTSITGALMLSSVPPIIWSLWQLVHGRKLDGGGEMSPMKACAGVGAGNPAMPSHLVQDRDDFAFGNVAYAG